jgi:hypothetical protein
MANNKRKTGFQIGTSANQTADSNLHSTANTSFDDLGDFSQEREKVKRILEANQITTLKVDYSSFSNHVFFDSAIKKSSIAQNRVLNQYPYNGNSEEFDLYFTSGSGYENYVTDNWPSYNGYLNFNGTTEYISTFDSDSKLFLGSSSLYVSTWINPVVNGENSILQVVSGNVASTFRNGYDFTISGTTSPILKFTLYSASFAITASTPYTGFTGSWHNVAAIYDQPRGLVSLFIDSNQYASSSVNYGPIEFQNANVYVGSGSTYTTFPNVFGVYKLYSGSMDEVRIMHTASSAFHEKFYNEPIYAEDYVKLRYTFNEGVIGLDYYDKNVIDYSKSNLNAIITNYTSSIRVAGAIFPDDEAQPILYNFHPSVIAFTSSMYQSASYYDDTNPNFIFNLIPEKILEVDDAQSGILTSFSLAMSRYFDEIKLYIDQFDNIKTTNYKGTDEVPDLFLSNLTKYFGWKLTEHFSDADPLEFFFGEGILASGSLNVPLVEIRNEFWRRILNNLPYLYASKGKRYNVDSLFNVLGLNKNNISIKEYGYLPGGSLQDDYIANDKPVATLGITGTFSSSYIKVPALFSGTHSSGFEVECTVQLPWANASYSSSILQGNLWQFASGTHSFDLQWTKDGLSLDTGYLILSGNDGQVFSSSNIQLFDGRFVYIGAGLQGNNKPQITVQKLNDTYIDFSYQFTGSLAFSGVFTSSSYDFLIGATSGSSTAAIPAQGHFLEYRFWNRSLSGSERNSHTLNFENYGTRDPLEFPNPLIARWPLSDNLSSSAAGTFSAIMDYSQNGHSGSGIGFPTSNNPFEKFIFNYNYLSPSVDLKWTENKIRIRNKTFLTEKDIASDTNEVSLEFNLIDALNKDIVKIFSTLTNLNEYIGKPINKYRDSYVDLEKLRKIYFQKLGDSINFNSFFNLFQWYDKKISDAIQQLLPTKVKFIGGEQVVQSHLLERPKYQYQYPVFHTPVTIPEIEIKDFYRFSRLNDEIF